MRLAELSWPQVEEAVKANSVVLIPIGTIEAHGPGLPLDVDAHTVWSIADAVGERTGALVAPVVAYGYSSTWTRYPGTISLKAETLDRVLADINESLIRGGFRRLFLLNGHRPELVNLEAIRSANRLPAGWDLGDHQPPVLLWRAWIGPDKHSGIIGHPEYASAEAGKAFFAAIVDRVSHYVGKIQRGEFTDYYSQPPR